MSLNTVLECVWVFFFIFRRLEHFVQCKQMRQAHWEKITEILGILEALDKAETKLYKDLLSKAETSARKERFKDELEDLNLAWVIAFSILLDYYYTSLCTSLNSITIVCLCMSLNSIATICVFW